MPTKLPKPEDILNLPKPNDILGSETEPKPPTFGTELRFGATDLGTGKFAAPSPSIKNKQTVQKIKDYANNPELAQQETPEEQSYLSRLGDRAIRGMNTLNANLARTPEFIYDIAALPQNIIAEQFDMPDLAVSAEKVKADLGIDNNVAQYYDNEVKKLAYLDQKYQKNQGSITNLIGEGKYKDAAKLLGEQIVESLPTTAAIAASGGLGASPTAVTLAGGGVFGAGKMDELKNRDDLSDAEKTSIALSTGLVEGLFENIGTANLGRVAKDIFVKEGAEKSAQAIKQTFIDTYKEALKKYMPISGVVSEGLEEAGTQFAQNAIDIYGGVDPNKKFTDGVMDAFIVGAGSGGVISSPTLLSKKRNDEVAKKQAEIETLDADIANENIPIEVKQELTQARQQKMEEINSVLEEDTNEQKALPDEVKREIEALNDRKVVMEQSLQSDMSEESKSIVTNRIADIDKQIETIVNENQTPKNIQSEPTITEDISVSEPSATPTTGEVIEAEKLILLDELAHKTSFEQFLQKYTAPFGEKIENANELLGVSETNTKEENTKIARKFYEEAKKRHGEVLKQRKQEAAEAKAEIDVDNIERLANEQVTEISTAETKADEGSKIELPPRIEGGQPVVMEYNEGEWKQKVGNEYTRVSEEQQNIAQQQFKTLKQGGQDAVKIREIEQSNQSEYKDRGETRETESSSNRNSNVESGEITQEKVLTPPQGKPLKLATRILESEYNDVKEGLKREGTTYVPEKMNLTKDEARLYVDAFDENDAIDEALKNVTDTNNKMKGSVRGTIGAELFDRYTKKANSAETIEERREYNNKAAKIASFSANQFRAAGQEVNAAKVWKELISKSPQGAISELQNEFERRNEEAIKKQLPDVLKARKELLELLKTTEGKEVISEEVSKEIEKRSETLFGKEQRKKITDFFDGLLVETKGKSFDATLGLPVAVWNGSVKAVKEAVLLGASAANAINAGVKYINDNHKGDWAQKDFEAIMKGGIKSVTPKEVYKTSKETEEKILEKWDKRLSKMKPENRKKLLADSLKELSELGALSEESFKKLYSEAIGLPQITPEIEQNIYDLITRINESDKAAEEYKKAIDNNSPDKKEAKEKWQKSVRDAKKANDELSNYFREESNIWDTLSTILQGNLLAPISIISNVASNIALQPIRMATNATASLTDYIVSRAAQNNFVGEHVKNENEFELMARLKGGWKGVIPGIKEGWKDLKEGLTSDEISQRDLKKKLDPMRAASELWADAHGKDKLSAQKKLNNWAEATLGVSAEAMFRLLNLGDKPFRKVAETGRAFEIAEKKGLKGAELEKFLEFPDETSAEEIKRAGDEATFQEEIGAVQKFGEWLNKLPGPFKLIAKAIFPYLKTPANIVVDSIDYILPEVSLAKSIYHAKKGDRRKSTEYFAKAVVGQIVARAIIPLVSMGLINGSGDEDDKKEKGAQYENIPPNSVNTSAINRLITGGDPSIQDDDKWVNYQKFGLIGMIMGAYSDAIASDGLAKSETMDYLTEKAKTVKSISRTALQSSFLAGSNAITTALAKGGEDASRLMTNMVNALSSIVIPNTAATIIRTKSDTMKELNDPSLSKEIVNLLKNKVGMGGELPNKVTLWGEPVKTAPEGRNKWVYNLFDITKGKQVDTENFGYKIFDKWYKDRNPEWLPSYPSKEIKENGLTVKLTPLQYEEYQNLIGNARKNLVKSYVESSDWEKGTDEEKLEFLKQLYDDGRDNGKELFINSRPEIYQKLNPEQKKRPRQMPN